MTPSHPDGPVPEPLAALLAYVDWWGGIHDEECPEDDTCDCSGKWINEGLTAAVNYLKAAPSSPQEDHNERLHSVQPDGDVGVIVLRLLNPWR